MDEYHSRPKYTGHCTVLPFKDWQPTQPRSKPEIHFDTKERETITSGNARLSELGLIEPAVHTPDEYISIICVREKKSGQYRTILNIKGPNKHIE